MRALLLGTAVLTVCGLGWYVDLVPRALSVRYQYLSHPRLSYALAFLTAPNIEVAPAPILLHIVPEPGECRAGCLLLAVYSDPLAVDATLRTDDGAEFRPTLEDGDLRFQVTLSGPTEAWLTWKPQVFDPGFGSGDFLCGQALSEVGVRPTRLDDGRVGVRLSLDPKPDALHFALLGPQPYVP